MIAKLKLILVAALLALPLVVVAAPAASACDKQPCKPACKVNPPGYNGDSFYLHGSLIECYY